jgi:hypothetical protein
MYPAPMLMPNSSPLEVLRFELDNVRAAGLGLLFAIVIIWQVPHVIVLRYMVLIALAALTCATALRALAGKAPFAGLDRRARTPFVLYGAFLVWCLAVALLVSTEPLASLKELRAEWLPTTLCLLIGYGAALRFDGEARGPSAAVLVVFWALILDAVLQLVVGASTYVYAGSIPILNFGGISDHKSNVTYTNTLALAFLLADVVAGSTQGSSFLGVSRRGQLVLFAVLLASTVVSVTRNGLVVFVLLTAIGGVLLVLAKRGHASRKWWGVFAALVAFTVAAASAGLKTDARWSGLVATAPVAWETEAHRTWLLGELNNQGLPLTAAGKPVEPSAYYRIAYLKEGMKLLVEHPWGTRLGRDTFNRLIHEKYGTAGMSHAHNGLIDLGVSVGFPGMALWLAFLISIAAWGLHGWRRTHDPLGLALGLCVAGYSARMLLDSTLRDHVIEEFALVVALLAGALAARAGPVKSG